jgi:hypothetical protein
MKSLNGEIGGLSAPFFCRIAGLEQRLFSPAGSQTGLQGDIAAMAKLQCKYKRIGQKKAFCVFVLSHIGRLGVKIY